MRRVRLAVVSMVTMIVSACGSTDVRPAEPPGAGERSGIVVDIGPVPDFTRMDDEACSRFAAADREPARRYATVRFFVGRHAHTRQLPLADRSAVQVGDRVVFQGSGCAPIARR